MVTMLATGQRLAAVLVLCVVVIPAHAELVVSPLGSADDPAPRPIVGGSPDVVLADDRVLVAWARDGVRVAGFAAADLALESVSAPLGRWLAPVGPVRAACNSSRCLLIWRENLKLVGLVVDQDGHRLSSELITVSAYANSGSAAVASDGQEFLVVSTEDRPAGGSQVLPRVYARRVRADGTVVDAAGTLLSGAGSSASSPTVTFTGAAYLVVFVAGVGLQARSVALDGTPGAAQPITSGSAAQLGPGTVACGPASCLLSASSYDPSLGTRSIWVRRLSHTGQPIDTWAELQGMPGLGPAIAYTGSTYVVASTGASEGVWSTALDEMGSPLGAATKLGAGSGPSLAAVPAGAVVVWAEDQTILGLRLDADGHPLDPIPVDLAFSVNQEDQAMLVPLEDGWIATWEDDRAFPAPSQQRAIRLDEAGAPVGDSFALFDSENAAVAAASEAGILWLWAPRSEALVRRMSLDGSWIDPEPILLQQPLLCCVRRLAVAAGAAEWVAVWVALSKAVRAATIDHDGTVTHLGEILVGNPPDSFVLADISFDGSDYYIVWGVEVGPGHELWAARFDPATGVDLSTATVVTPTYSIGGDFALECAQGVCMLAYWYMDHDLELVTWPGGGAAPAPILIHVTQDGTATREYSPSLAWDGLHFVLMWSADSFTAEARVRAQLVDVTGALVGSPLTIGASEWARVPFVASKGMGEGLLAVTATEPTGIAIAAFSEHGLPIGAQCSESWRCVSGHCVEGVCCDSACDSAPACFVCSAALGASADGTCTDICPAPEVDGGAASEVDGGTAADATTSTDASCTGSCLQPDGGAPGADGAAPDCACRVGQRPARQVSSALLLLLPLLVVPLIRRRGKRRSMSRSQPCQGGET